MSQLRKQLSDADKRRLAADAHYAPEWVAQIMRKIAQECVLTGRVRGAKMRKETISPFDRDVVKRLKKSPEYAATYFAEMERLPLSLQLAVLRRLQGVTQEKMAAKLRVKQRYISKLEKPGSDHLLSKYERAARLLHGHLAIIPDGAKVIPAWSA